MKILLNKIISPYFINARKLSLLSTSKNLVFPVSLTPTHLTSTKFDQSPVLRSQKQWISRREYCSDANSCTASGSNLLSSPSEFVNVLKNKGIRRCFIVNNKGVLETSHPVLSEVAETLKSGELEFDDHEAIFLTYGSRTELLMGVFLWRTNRGQGSGGVDLRPMRSLSDMLIEGNRFSKHLGIKAALAGIWSGGGKGIIAAPASNQHWDPKFRQDIFWDFGEFLTSLNGCMIAGAGVGSMVPDMDMMLRQTRYISNVSSSFGGSATTAWYTGKGVVKAMEAAVDFLKLGSLEGKTIAIQGGGNVGAVVIDELLSLGARHIYVTECNGMRVDDLQDKFAQRSKGRLKINKVSFTDLSVFRQHCDIFSPCARGQVLNKRTIPLLDTKIICGAANCQLDSEEDQESLLDMNITYVTDVVPNRMGIVSKQLEPYGRLEQDAELQKHLDEQWEHSIYQTTLRVLQHASDCNISPEKSAFILGEKLSEQKHPLYPDRSQNIIKNLVDTGWHEGNDFWRGQFDFVYNSDLI